jgi:acetylornithine deacetylase/succinyl-diaminopimelate desuccinylase-like protein
MQVFFGARGVAGLELTAYGPLRPLHSGHYGNWAPNPAVELVHLLASLRDEEGRILIPGFYDDVRPLAAWEREEFAKLPWDENAYRAELGVPELFGEEGFTTRERTWGRPTCDVNGIFGGYMGKGAKTVLPSWGGAKVSMRLVPDQDPKQIARLFTDYVQAVAPKGVTVEVTNLHGADPVVVEVQGPIVDAALDAMQDIWGARPVRIREGGSIPIVSTFASVLKCPVLLLGFGLNDDGLHSPNEKFNISHFYKGIRSVARLLDRLADL